MRDEGIPDTEIEELCTKVSTRYKQLVEKSVCRMLCYKDENLSLLPWCFDRIKSWNRKRQQWTYYLDYVERKYNRNRYLDAVERAF